MELWDIYDKDGNKTGRTVTREEYFNRGLSLDPGDHHLIVIIPIVNSNGEIFCTRRSPDKPWYPGMWENSGGAVLAGETSRQGAVRELFEETGLVASEHELEFFYRSAGPGYLKDIYLLRRDFPLSQVVFQEGETDMARWIPYEEWERLGKAGEILTPAGADNDEFFEKLRAYIHNFCPEV